MTDGPGPRPAPSGDAAPTPGRRRPAEVVTRPARAEEYEEAGRATRSGFSALFGEEDGEYLDQVADVAGRAGRTTVLVALSSGRILGSITVELIAKVDLDREVVPGEAHLRMLGVAPEAQGRGVGEALVSAAISLAREAGKERVTLGTLAEMTTAQRLYARMGFRASPPVEHAPGRSHMTYEMDLEPGRSAG